jgi:type IV pilus assembly protein PilW
VQAAFPALNEAQAGVAGCAFAAGQVIKPVSSKAVCIRYQPSDRLEVDCLGNGRPANTSSLALPYAEPVEAYIEKLAVNTSQQLVCTSKDGSATLIEGIVDVRFDYGVGRYGTADATTYSATPASNAPVRSVRYAVLLSTAASVRTASKSASAWRYWYGMAAPSAAQGRLYQVIKGTTALRNLLP